ncbi:MAG: hypothetical protein Q7R83_04310 [bacterium]|nr:hypothetical protein [bacterium]
MRIFVIASEAKQSPIDRSEIAASLLLLAMTKQGTRSEIAASLLFLAMTKQVSFWLVGTFLG